MSFTGPLEDRILIRELYDTYADGANRMDRATWLGCWTSDACWKTHYFDLTDREAIGRQYDQIMADVTTTTFFTQVCAIEVDGDRAKARAIAKERLVMSGGGSYRLTGRYEDELVRQGGRWLFARRIYHVMIEELPQ